MNIFIFIFWIIIGLFTGYLAKQRGRDPIIWFLIGMFIGVFGLLILLLLPAYGEKEAPIQKEEDVIPVTVTTLDFQGQEWFYLDSERNQKGPVNFSTLVEAWKQKEINETTLVWSEGMEGWCPINEQDDLKSFFEKAE